MTNDKMKIGSLVLLGSVVGAGVAHADGVGQIMTSKSIPAATIQIIDPESGTSSGGGAGDDVRLAVGDIILFRFEYFPVPDKIIRGIQGYLTEYVPAGTEVVGFRLIDANGNTVRPRWPGVTNDDCGAQCDNFNSVPNCSGGTTNMDSGTLPAVYGDTGIFFTTDSRLAKNPANAFITLTNGTLMSPEPRAVDSIDTLYGLTVSSPVFAHNAWDWIQVRAFGISTATSGNSGVGTTPLNYGSPVAGSGTFYPLAAVDSGGAKLCGNTGPFVRAKYPGAQLGSNTLRPGSPLSGQLFRTNTEANTGACPALGCVTPATMGGTDITPASPVDPVAVRAALGEVRVGEPGFAEVALRVQSLPIDPSFGGSGGNVDCGEVTGSDTSGGGASKARDNPWPLYLGSPNCVFLTLLFELDANKAIGSTGDIITYTLHGKNLSTTATGQTGVVRRIKFDGSRVSLVAGSITGGGVVVSNCEGDGQTCIVWPTTTLFPSDEYTFTFQLQVGGGGQVTNPVGATYISNQIPGGFRTSAITIIKSVAVVHASVTPPATNVAAGGSVTLSGNLRNDGVGDATYDTVSFIVPTGWSVTGYTLAGGGGACTTSGRVVECPGAAFSPGQIRALSFTVNVAGGAATDNYPIDIQIIGNNPGFGGAFETYLNEVVVIPVNQTRTVAPILDCPIASGTPAITGTAPAGSTVCLYFNLIQRACGTADGTGHFSIPSSAWSAFGTIYGGLEVTATSDTASTNVSPYSLACFVSNVPACNDLFDNDADGLTDYPADPGCDSPLDNTEIDTLAQCMDTIDNDTDGFTDYPADLSCQFPTDPSEAGAPACSDGSDNDGDGLVDLADPGCTGPNDPNEITYPQCMDGVDNADPEDAIADFPSDPGCHSGNDNDETNLFSSGEIEARLLIAFDTSGSMNWNVCNNTFTGGDGSSECNLADVTCATCNSPGCGDGVANDSRIYKVKAGISDVVSAFGEVEYGLMRFHQRSVPFACPNQNASLQSGGWQGGGAAPCGGGFNAGDLLVGFGPENQYELLQWMDGADNYGGVPPAGLDIELRGSGTTPLAGILSSALTYLSGVRSGDSVSTCRPYRVVLVTDGAESCGGDPEAAARALWNALKKPGTLPGQAQIVPVIGFATPDPSIQANLNAIACGGNGGFSNPAVPNQCCTSLDTSTTPATCITPISASAIIVDDSTELSVAMSSIITETILVELCNGADDDCDALIDEDFPDLGQPCNNGMLGACFRTGQRVCTADHLGTTCNAPPGIPGTEICNGIDDNCDGLVDNLITGTCEMCTGTEVCNGVDDDCDCPGDTNMDGTRCGPGDTGVDEGTLPGEGEQCGTDVGSCSFGTLDCINGVLTCTGGQGPITETCNNSDDDCDGIIDQFSVQCYTFAGMPPGCTSNGMGGYNCLGECRSGLDTCVGGVASGCVGQITPVGELCNGRDDDCDGMIDEDFPEVSMACDNGLAGECRTTGVYACLPDGSGTYCTAPPVGIGTEICNGEDDDCDCPGDTNGDGVVCGPGDTNVDEPPLPAPIGGECGGGAFCAPGHWTCVMGEVVCTGGGMGSAEVCDGFDNDCDNLIDEPTLPGVGDECYTFASGCTIDTSTSPATYDCCSPAVPTDQCRCKPGAKICQPTEPPPGASLECDGSDVGPLTVELCNLIDDDCDGEIDEMAECPNPEDLCVEGECLQPCVDMEFQCPFGYRCMDFTAGRFCVPDLCAGVACDPGIRCNPDSGACDIDLCNPSPCLAGEECLGTVGGYVCQDCFDFGCLDGELCVPGTSGVGECVEDPCFDVTCDPGSFCQDGECVSNVCDPPCTDDAICDPETLTCIEACPLQNCRNVRCNEGETCDPRSGRCGADPCLTINCSDGQVPTLVCTPAELSCTCAAPPVPPDELVLATGGGGCACRVESRSERSPAAAGLGAGLLGLAILLFRRKRR